jgi:DNA-binding CsgD family transcriptional regulator
MPSPLAQRPVRAEPVLRPPAADRCRVVCSATVVTDDGRTHEYVEPERPPPGRAFLEIVRGASGSPIPIRDAIVLGRDVGCEGRFPVEGVSRRHARIVCDRHLLRLVDLGSRNGTFLNGRKVETAELRSGDEIRIGPVVLRLRFAGEVERAPAKQALETDRLALLRPREREIAMLVAEGLTNGEIAARLGISPSTVGRHLANCYERLGIHSRAALAALVSTGA